MDRKDYTFEERKKFRARWRNLMDDLIHIENWNRTTCGALVWSQVHTQMWWEYNALMPTYKVRHRPIPKPKYRPKVSLGCYFSNPNCKRNHGFSCCEN